MTHDLPDLTDKQDALIKNYLSGMSKRQAYLASYTPTTTTYASISKLTYEAFNAEPVKAWLQHIYDHRLSSHAITLESHLNELQELRESAKTAGDLSAAIRAEELRGKAAGLYIKRTESVRLDLTPTMILDKIAAAGPDGKQIAQQLAQARSIKWQPK